MEDVLGIILLLIIGLVAGSLGGLLGIGGCVIMLPALTFVFSYPCLSQLVPSFIIC